MNSTITPSTKTIVTTLQTEHHTTHKFYFNLGIILSAILALDLVVIIGARIQNLNHIAWIGIYLLIIGVGFCFKTSKREKENYIYLKEWYENKKEEYLQKAQEQEQ